MGAILIDKVMVLEWFAHYKICLFFKSDSYALTMECLYEWIFAGRGQEMTWDGLVTLEMSANSCSSFFCQASGDCPLVFLRKTQHVGCQGFSEKGKNWKYWELLKAWGSCHAWTLGNLSLHLSLHPRWSPGARQLQLLSKEVGSPGQVPISVLQPFAQTVS